MFGARQTYSIRDLPDLSDFCGSGSSRSTIIEEKPSPEQMGYS